MHTPIELPSPATMIYWMEKAFDHTGLIDYAPDENAPGTWEELQEYKYLTVLTPEEAFCWDSLPYLPVYDGGCENTIYGAPEYNYMFRAWHDSLHLRHDLDFSVKGELRTALRHQTALMQVGAPVDVRRAFWADTAGQVQYNEITGEFPTNQVNFVRLYLGIGKDALLKLVADYGVRV